ncbi:MAG: hypothetical protein LUC88_09200, partial [Prevotella sp.]|nr:hypothetical protein [Prevotella sp.]
KDNISIIGTYCNKKYKVKEFFSINDFITDSIVHYDDITMELKEANKHLKKILNNYGKHSQFPSDNNEKQKCAEDKIL